MIDERGRRSPIGITSLRLTSESLRVEEAVADGEGGKVNEEEIVPVDWIWVSSILVVWGTDGAAVMKDVESPVMIGVAEGVVSKLKEFSLEITVGTTSLELSVGGRVVGEGDKLGPEVDSRSLDNTLETHPWF